MPNGVICGGAADGSNQLGAIVTCHAMATRPAGAGAPATARSPLTATTRVRISRQTKARPKWTRLRRMLSSQAILCGSNFFICPVGASLPQLLARELRSFDQRGELRPHYGRMDSAVERALREAAVGAGHHVVAAGDAREPHDAFGHEFR